MIIVVLVASRDLACTRQSNNRKEEKLKRVKSKDFDKKYTQANVRDSNNTQYIILFL